MSTTILVQARMDSTRLPGKVMLPVKRRTPMLARVVDAAKATALRTIVVVPSGKVNDPIRDYCMDYSYEYSTWPVEGVRDPLAEFTYATRCMHNFDWIIRICADCPMLQPHHISMFASLLTEERAGTFLTNRPADMDGYDLEGFTVGHLRTAYLHAEGEQREHICPYMYQLTSVRFSVMGNPHTGTTPGKCSVDTQEELEYVRKLLRAGTP